MALQFTFAVWIMMIEDSLEYDDNHYMNQSPGLTIMIHCDSMKLNDDNWVWMGNSS